VKCVLTHINSDGGDCANSGPARHGGAPAPDKPPTHSESRWGRERGRSIPSHRVYLGGWSRLPLL